MNEKIKKSSSYINFKKAFANLKQSIASPILEPRDRSGIIKDFEMAYELSWKVLKKLLLVNGHETLGAKDVYTKAFQLGYIHQQEDWLQMIDDRNQTSHIYDEAETKQIIKNIQKQYMHLFEDLLKTLDKD